MNSLPLCGPVEVDVNAVMNITQYHSRPSSSGHQEYIPTLVLKKRRVSPKKLRRPQLGPHEGLTCPLLGDKCPEAERFENCAEAKAHIFWHFNAFQCEECGKCFGKSDGLKRHEETTTKCAERRSKVEPMLSPKIKQRVKNLQDATGEPAIMDAIEGWRLDFKLSDSRTASSNSQERRTRKFNQRKSANNATQTRTNTNTNTSASAPLPPSHTLQQDHPVSWYPSTNIPGSQMHYTEDMNAWHPAAISAMSRPTWGNTKYENLDPATRMGQRDSGQIVHSEVYPSKYMDFGSNVAGHVLQTISTIVTPNTALQTQIQHMQNTNPPVNQSSWPYRQEADVEGHYPTFIGLGHTHDQGSALFPANIDLWHHEATCVPLCPPVPSNSPPLGAYTTLMQAPTLDYIRTPSTNLGPHLGLQHRLPYNLAAGYGFEFAKMENAGGYQTQNIMQYSNILGAPKENGIWWPDEMLAAQQSAGWRGAMGGGSRR